MVFTNFAALLFHWGTNPFTNESQLNQPTIYVQTPNTVYSPFQYTRYSFLMIQLNIHVYKCV